ncbi:EKC/KEOPS complex subunit BUD32 [Abortiporus biennis]
MTDASGPQDTPPPKVGQKYPSTPVTNKVSGYSYLQWEDFSKRLSHRKLNREMTRKEVDSHIVQIPTDEFLKKFVPPKLDSEVEEAAIQDVRRNTVVDDILDKTNVIETERYFPLIKLVEPSWEGTNLVPRNVSRWSQKDGNLKITPDIVAYEGGFNSKTPHDISKEEQNDASKSKKSTSTPVASKNDTAPVSSTSSAVSAATISTSIPLDASLPSSSSTSMSSDGARNSAKDPRDYVARMNYNDVELFFEDKVDNDVAPLQKNPKGKFLLSNERSMDARGQIGEYAAEIMRCQHRCHLFSVLTVHNTVRFFRWDRSGVIASMPVNFCTDDGLNIFITFLYRFARMTPRERGRDVTVLEPTADDLEKLKEFKATKLPKLQRNHRDFFKESFDDQEAERNWPLRVIELEPFHHQCTEDKSVPPAENKLRLLIRAPRISTRSPFGRGTKGFVALDTADLKLKFLKDSWRYDGGSYHPELEVYQRLYKHDVKNIATVEGGGDVLDPDPQVAESKWDAQRTASHGYLKTDDLHHLPQAHHRLLIRQLGTPMEKYHSSFSLSYYLSLIIAGHRDAWEKAAVLHRDISPSNMLICENPEDGVTAAFLVDWDLCRYKEDLNDGPSQKTRSGTWAFISALLLRYPTKQHELSDDLESFIHVLHWFCLRFHTHDMTGAPSDIADALSRVYFMVIREKGYEQGSKQKLKHMLGGTQCFDLTPGLVSQGLIDLVDRLSDLCKQHYATVDMVALDNARAQLMQDQMLTTRTNSSDAPPSKETDGEESDSDPGDLIELPGFGKLVAEEEFEVEEKLEVEEELEVEAHLRETHSRSPTPTQLSPFLTHAKILAVFDSMLPKEVKDLKRFKIWDMPFSRNSRAVKTDKITDQFNLEMFQRINMLEPKSRQSQSSVTGGKRSSSAANIDSLAFHVSKKSKSSQSSAVHGTVSWSKPAIVVEGDDPFA